MSAGPAPSHPRARVFEGAYNLRDLGGLRTEDGRLLRLGRVYRSDYPAFADIDAGRALRELGIGRVVDLRRRNEARVECVAWESHGVAYRRWPLSAGAESSWQARYVAYLENRPETVVGAVREVMASSDGAVLFHCAAGKDRTGVVAALLLSVLGVGEDDIVGDYALSAPSVEAVLGRLRAIELYAEMLQGSSLADQQPEERHMRDLLAWLAGRGGAEQWLVDHGLHEQEVADFRGFMFGRPQ